MKRFGIALTALIATSAHARGTVVYVGGAWAAIDHRTLLFGAYAAFPYHLVEARHLRMHYVEQLLRRSANFFDAGSGKFFFDLGAGQSRQRFAVEALH